MKKLQLNKEVITSLESNQIKGGIGEQLAMAEKEADFTLSIRFCSTPQATCFSCIPGSADSCGLCSTVYRCK